MIVLLDIWFHIILVVHVLPEYFCQCPCKWCSECSNRYNEKECPFCAFHFAIQFEYIWCKSCTFTPVCTCVQYKHEIHKTQYKGNNPQRTTIWPTPHESFKGGATCARAPSLECPHRWPSAQPAWKVQVILLFPLSSWTSDCCVEPCTDHPKDC